MNKENADIVKIVSCSNKTKKEKGITLVALIVTIIILLILAGVSISSLTGNGLFEKAKLAKEKQENAQKQEDKTLENYENAINYYVGATRNTNNVPMTSRKILVRAILPNTLTETREAGSYLASSSNYTKTNSEQINEYLTFTQDSGWKVLKSGFYQIYYYNCMAYTKNEGWSDSFLIINGDKEIVLQGWTSSANYPTGAGYATFYFEKDDVIDYEFKPQVTGNWSTATFKIYALF